MDTAILDLLHRLPQSNMKENTAALGKLVPEKAQEILHWSDLPLATAFDEEAKKEFVCCEYNREGDSYR